MSAILVAASVSLLIAAAGYAALIIWHRRRYDHVHHLPSIRTWELLDCFIPSPEVLEHHQAVIDAPAGEVFAAAKQMRLMDSPLVRATIKALAEKGGAA